MTTHKTHPVFTGWSVPISSFSFFLLDKFRFLRLASIFPLVHSFFLDVGDDWITETKAASNSLRVSAQFGRYVLRGALRPSLSYSRSPLMIAENPTVIIVFALKLQFACSYSVGSVRVTCSREQWKTTSSGEMLYENINIHIWIQLFIKTFT